MDKEVFFNTVKDELFFKVRASANQDESGEVLRIKTKGDRYFLAAYTGKEDLIENNFSIKKMSFDEYVDIVFESADTDGVAVNVEGEYILYNHLYLRWLQMEQDYENFLCDLDKEEYADDEKREEQIGEYHQERYIYHLNDAKKMWNLEAYEKAYDILYFLGRVYPGNVGETLYYCGMICEKIGNMSSAEQLYRQAVREEEYNYWLYYRLAQFYRRMGKSDLEIDVYEKAYTHHRFNIFNKEQLQNDGIQYILTELIQYESTRKKRLQRFAYRKYAMEISEKYKFLPEFGVYNYLDD